MAAAVVGADVGELRELANRLAQLADRLQQSSRGLNSAIANTRIWRGNDADRFRSEWHSSSMPVINSAADTLRSAADALRRNADEQDQASAAGGGSNGVATGAPASGDLSSDRAAPHGLNGMWKELGDIPRDSSGYRVQRIQGAPGEPDRYIVYIVGTDGSQTQTALSNISAIRGDLDKEQVAALERLIPKGSPVMLVGYSQGGIDAQNIAASGKLSVEQIVTFGSPVRKDLNIPAIHLVGTSDPVPGSGLFPFDKWSTRAEKSNPNVEVFSRASNVNTNPLDWWEAIGAKEHVEGYGNLSSVWDDAARSAADARAASSAENLANFQGYVIGQVDIAANGAADWNPLPTF